ncbi:hypothetical protein ACPRNU_21985 [Chromobacterium vaccinii]|uniref:hypothetical protein n=1 Tax=Chromobacterium TaxID=535 RepID=UPI001305483B|nr:hypothetical protein [Chromobacterium sp. ATCC 53434]
MQVHANNVPKPVSTKRATQPRSKRNAEDGAAPRKKDPAQAGPTSLEKTVTSKARHTRSMDSVVAGSRGKIEYSEYSEEWLVLPRRMDWECEKC